jgi:hypothetical protein
LQYLEAEGVVALLVVALVTRLDLRDELHVRGQLALHQLDPLWRNLGVLPKEKGGAASSLKCHDDDEMRSERKRTKSVRLMWKRKAGSNVIGHRSTHLWSSAALVGTCQLLNLQVLGHLLG